MSTVLWHIELSHYNEKARWALDYKGVSYDLRTPVPGLHGPVAMALTRSGHRRLPVLKLDGRHIGDSTAIIAALEQRFPDPPLYPADPAQRAQALEHEDFFDEHLGPDIRRFGWQQMLGEPAVAVDALAPQATGARRQVMELAIPVFRPLIRRDYAVSPESAEDARRKIVAAADRVEAAVEETGTGFLVGEHFSVADLTAAALFTPVLRPPQRPYLPTGELPPATAELVEELMDRPTGPWVFDMFARFR